VTGAAARVGDQPASTLVSAPPVQPAASLGAPAEPQPATASPPAEVVSEMASGAALGALVGVARALTTPAAPAAAKKPSGRKGSGAKATTRKSSGRKS